MAPRDDEEQLLRDVALQNAASIGLARQRAEEELLHAKEALELKTLELARSVAMLRATLESTTDGILVTDGAGTVTGFNEKFVDMWHLAGESLHGANHRHLLRVTSLEFDDPEAFLVRVDDLYAAAPPESYDLLELADGRVFERFSRIQFVEQTNVGRVWSFRDITDSRHAEGTLKQQTEWLKTTLGSIADGVVATDTEGRVTFVNGVAEALTGWPELEALGRPLAEVFRIVAADTRRPIENPAALALREQCMVAMADDTILIARDGTETPIDDSAAPIRDNDGHIHGVVLVFRGIAERKRAEAGSRFLAAASATLAELTAPEETLRRVAALAVPAFADWCAIDLVEPTGSIRRLVVTHVDPAKAQQALERFARFPPQVTDRRGVSEVVRTGNTEWAPEIPESLFEEAIADVEQRRITKQMGLKSYICTPLRSRTATIGAVTFATAESGRIYSAIDLAAAEDLAYRAGIAIENAMLLATLKDADRRKDEFLAMLAHELRNPLAPIRNAAEIIRLKAPPVPELHWAREVIQRQVDQMTRLVDDLLDVSRITTGRIELRIEEIDLAAVLRDAVEGSRPLIEDWGHELVVTTPPEPICLMADSTRLTQVFMNLLNNAAKYTDRGGRIRLTAARAGDDVVVRVSDTGIGIPADMLSRIFDLFAQADSSLERSRSGLGIGLTLVQRLVQLHGGSVEVESGGLGKGSEFAVRLPVLSPQVSLDHARGLTGAGQGDGSPVTLRILVVDDNRDAADSLALVLSMTGNRVSTAYDGLEAVRAASILRPDVVLMDIGLPKLDGYAAARRIREDLGDTTVLIAVTGWGQEEDRLRSEEAGFDHHVTKPVEQDVLRRLFASVKAAGPAEPGPPDRSA